MRVRWIGLTLALVLLGLAAGVGLGRTSVDEPAQLATAYPMAAVDPSWPAEPAKVLPDPTFPALAPDVRTHLETVGVPPFSLTLPIPNGWTRVNRAPGEWRWFPTDDPDLNTNTYFLRVGLVGNLHQPVPDALAERLADLRDATAVAEFDVEETTPGGFTGTYVVDEHRRVATERFLPGELEPTAAFAWIALIGREVDRPGMADLFARITNGATQ